MHKILLLTALAFLFACKEENKPATTQKEPEPEQNELLESFYSNEPIEKEEKTMTDPRDNKTYKIVKIGEQTWMAKNLNYEMDGSVCYNNYQDNCAKYGRLYDWKMAMKACPKGWHLPTNKEWDELFHFVDGTNGKETNYNSDVAGKYLKAIYGWKDNNGKSGNGEDKFGFAALPGGYGTDFNYIEENGYWWSANKKDNYTSYYRYMDYIMEHATFGYESYSTMFSVRCVKD